MAEFTWKEKIMLISKKLFEKENMNKNYFNSLTSLLLLLWAVIVLFSNLNNYYIFDSNCSKIIALIILIYLSGKEYELSKGGN